MEILNAKTVVEMTEKAIQEREQNVYNEAREILRDINFNQWVRTAALEGKWTLQDSIVCPNHAVAEAMAEILRDLGYNAGAKKRGYTGTESVVIVGWSQVATRAAAGEKR